MRGILLFFLKLICYEVVSSAYYFHESSHIEMTSPDGDIDFGYSLDYQKKSNNLVVGAPRSDLNGKVFTCPLTDIINKKPNLACKRANIDIDTLAKDFRKAPTGMPDHPCHLGASISVTDDYIFTCAPLCSKYLRLLNGSLQLGTFGTCFVYNGHNASRYCGLLEKYDQKIGITPVDNFYGGFGWTTFSDPKNKFIIIVKSTLTSYITYLDIDNPLKPVMENPIPSNVLSVFSYKGISFAAGIFFNDKRYLYAFTMKKLKQTGGVAFFYYDEDTKSLEILYDDDYGRPVLIRDDQTISMYGTALHSADLNNDSFSELIVGAPGFSNLDGDYELGAIFLYKGGGEVVERMKSTHRITGNEDSTRFGTSIASTDLDGDGLAEIFVSAPYGEKGGSVHILLGYEIRQLLHGSTEETSLSSLLHTQTILIEHFKSFGYSLHAFERNGANFLAVGAPSTGKVAIYRSLSLVSITVSSRVQGDKSVRERDTSFTVIVTVKLESSSKSLNSDMKLFLSTEVTGDDATIKGNATNEIELSKIKSERTYNVVVLLGKPGPGDYKFTAVVNDKKPFNQKDYDRSLVKLTPQSVTKSVLEVPRHCKGEDCVPEFKLNFEWSGGSGKYILGSNESETMQLIIDNVGNSTYDSCAWVKVSGAQIAVLACNKPDDGIWYKCPLRIERNDMHIIVIRLDMSRPTNKDKSLNVDVHLFNHCTSFNSNATLTRNKTIEYIFNNDDISIEGSSTDRNFTDNEIYNDKSNTIISIQEMYKITNNATISWKDVAVVLKYRDLSFVLQYMIVGKNKCETKKSEGFVKLKCIINIESKSTEFIRTAAILSKSKLSSHLRKRKLVLNSTLELHFESADTKYAEYSTTIFVQRDAEFWETQNFIVAISIIVGLLILGTLSIILYKNGFFKRKGKKKVKHLRESIRKGTFRRPSTAAETSDNKKDTQEGQS